MKAVNADPRRVLDTKGKIKILLSTLNPGQQCAMKHVDGSYWYPYILVAHHHMVSQGEKKLRAFPGRSVVKFEGIAWDVPTSSWVYLVDGTTEGLRKPTLYGPNGDPIA